MDSMRKIAIINNGDTEKRHLNNVEHSLAVLEKHDYETFVISPRVPKHAHDHYVPANTSAAMKLVASIKSDDNDEVVLYTTGHGDQDGAHGRVCHGLDCDTGALMKAYAKMRAGKRVVIMDQCFSGNELQRYMQHANTLFIAAGSRGENTCCQLFAPPFWSNEAPDPGGDGVSWLDRFAFAAAAFPGRSATPQFVPLGGYLPNDKPHYNDSVLHVHDEDALYEQLHSARLGTKTFLYFDLPGCGACTDYSPQYEKQAKDAQGHHLFMRTRNTALAERFGVTSFPTVVSFDAHHNAIAIPPEYRHALLDATAFLSQSPESRLRYLRHKLRYDIPEFSEALNIYTAYRNVLDLIPAAQRAQSATTLYNYWSNDVEQMGELASKGELSVNELKTLAQLTQLDIGTVDDRIALITVLIDALGTPDIIHSASLPRTLANIIAQQPEKRQRIYISTLLSTAQRSHRSVTTHTDPSAKVSASNLTMRCIIAASHAATPSDRDSRQHTKFKARIHNQIVALLSDALHVGPRLHAHDILHTSANSIAHASGAQRRALHTLCKSQPTALEKAFWYDLIDQVDQSHPLPDATLAIVEKNILATIRAASDDAPLANAALQLAAQLSQRLSTSSIRELALQSAHIPRDTLSAVENSWKIFQASTRTTLETRLANTQQLLRDEANDPPELIADAQVLQLLLGESAIDPTAFDLPASERNLFHVDPSDLYRSALAIANSLLRTPTPAVATAAERSLHHSAPRIPKRFVPSAITALAVGFTPHMNNTRALNVIHTLRTTHPDAVTATQGQLSQFIGSLGYLANNTQDLLLMAALD